MTRETEKYLERLRSNYRAVAENLAALGVEVTPQDGLGELADLVPDAVPPLGSETSARISASGAIFRGDPVRLTRELESAEEIRFALEDVHVVASAQLYNNAVVVVFGQNDSTYIKAMQYANNYWMMGATRLLIEGEIPLTAAIVVQGNKSPLQVGVFYNSDAAGMVTCVNFTNLSPTIGITDIWDAYDPVNIAAAPQVYGDGYTNTAVVGYTRQGVGFEGKAYMMAMRLLGDRVHTGPEVELMIEPDAPLEHLTDEFARAWAIACYSTTAYLSYPIAEGRRGLVVALLDGVQLTCKMQRECVVAGGAPVAALTPTLGVDPAVSIAVAHGVTRTQDAATKSLLALEFWHGPACCTGLYPLCYGEEDVHYGKNLGRVCVGMMGSGSLVIGYSVEDTMMATVVAINEFRPDAGPGVPVGSFSEFADIVGLNGSYAVLVTQRDGNGYLCALRVVDVVAACNVGDSHGIALQGGASGNTIRIALRA